MKYLMNHRLRVAFIGALLLLVAISSHSQYYRVDPYFNGVFPSSEPGPQGAWAVENFVPQIEIPSPMKITAFPGFEEYLVLSKDGKVYTLHLETKEQRKVLDITERVMNAGEAGSVGMAIHPSFGQGGVYDYIYIYYRYRPSPNGDLGYNRLSKFPWDATTQTFDADAEEILIQQYDRHVFHNAGGMVFGKDDYLYLSAGDLGGQDMIDIRPSVQTISGGFFSGIFRLDVIMDGSDSHPIRRQPSDVGTPPAGWPSSFSRGYQIPNDNPWQASDSSILEEYYALGLRAPYSVFMDDVTGDIWIGDVGSDKFEEINRLEAGHNYEWPYLEGERVSDRFDRPDAPVGTETGPHFTYGRDIGTSLVGGAVYRGLRYPSLDEQILFADFTSNSIMSTSQTDTPRLEVLISNINAFGLPLPERGGIVALSVVGDGDILLSVVNVLDFTAPGLILRVTNQDIVPDPPSRLSEIGVFTDMETRTIAEGFIPYRVNAPLWSDGALKRRWISVPNDGTFDTPEEKIAFDANAPWTFPEGTVFVKHFDLPIDSDRPDEVRPVETRFMVMTEDGTSYGLTYKWNAEGTEAFLQQSRSEADLPITIDGIATTQRWSYPSRSQCITCHNPQAGYVLGVNTHQLNGEVRYPDEGEPKNQLTKYHELGMFDQAIGVPEAYRRAYDLHETDASLDLRIRSYIDANCAFCHRENGSVRETNIDLRLSNDLGTRLANLETESRASTGDFVVVPGDHERSELWVRDASRSENQMPPIATNMVHQAYIDSLAKWIGDLEFTLERSEVILDRNPVDEVISATLGENWHTGYEVRLYDMKGQLVRRHTAAGSRFGLPVHDLSAGLYILDISGSGEKFVERIMVL